MKTAKELAEEYAEQYSVGRLEVGLAEYRSDLRLAWYSGYDAGLFFAAKAVRETVEDSRKEGAK